MKNLVGDLIPIVTIVAILLAVKANWQYLECSLLAGPYALFIIVKISRRRDANSAREEEVKSGVKDLLKNNKNCK